MLARLDTRQGDASDADRAVLERQLLADPGAMAWRRIDASGTPERAAAQARRALGLAAGD